MLRRLDRKTASGLILGSGLIAAAGILALANTPGGSPIAAAEPPQWTQVTGAGVSVPACGSGSASVSCSGSSATVSFSWSAAGPAPNGASCSTAAIRVNGSTIASGLPCNGSYTWGGASPNTTYSYEIVVQ